MSEKLYKIMCNLPNAATEINGIQFEENDGELVAMEVSANDAKCFETIPGYEVSLIGDQNEDRNAKNNDNEDGHEGDHNSVINALKKMNVTDIKDFLKAQPDAWNHVLTLEEKRTDKRQGVMDAVKSAKAFLNENTDSKPETKPDSND